MISIAKKWSFNLLVCFCLCLSVCWISEAKPSEGQAEIVADTIDYDDSIGEVRLLGNVRLSYGEAVITSSFARYRTKKQEADFQGKVKASFNGNNLTGTQLTALFMQKQVQMRGKAVLLGKHIINGESLPMRLEAESISYDWAERKAKANGQVAFKQGKRSAYADIAEYDEISQTVCLRGNVRFEQGDNDWLMSENVTIDLTKRKIEAKGRVSGRLVVVGNTAEKKSERDNLQLPEATLIEPSPRTEVVDDVSSLLLPGLRD